MAGTAWRRQSGRRPARSEEEQVSRGRQGHLQASARRPPTYLSIKFVCRQSFYRRLWASAAWALGPFVQVKVLWECSLCVHVGVLGGAGSLANRRNFLPSVGSAAPLFLGPGEEAEAAGRPLSGGGGPKSGICGKDPSGDQEELSRKGQTDLNRTQEAGPEHGRDPSLSPIDRAKGKSF